MRYTDACIYVPDIKIIKTDTDVPQRLPENKWQTVDVICCAAVSYTHLRIWGALFFYIFP